jgi:RNA polymerase sigma-70 factor (ECF subfamily)
MNLDHSTRSAMLAAIPQLKSFAISLCRDRDLANDLAQQTFLRAYTNLDKFKPGSNMVGWLSTILRNEYYSDYRKRRREVEDVDGIYAETLMVEPGQMPHVEFEDLRAALAELPGDMRKPLILVSVDGLSYDEAARLCNCSVGTVKSRVHRARARLAARLAVDSAI